MMFGYSLRKWPLIHGPNHLLIGYSVYEIYAFERMRVVRAIIVTFAFNKTL